MIVHEIEAKLCIKNRREITKCGTKLPAITGITIANATNKYAFTININSEWSESP